MGKLRHKEDKGLPRGHDLSPCRHCPVTLTPKSIHLTTTIHFFHHAKAHRKGNHRDYLSIQVPLLKSKSFGVPGTPSSSDQLEKGCQGMLLASEQRFLGLASLENSRFSSELILMQA